MIREPRWMGHGGKPPVIVVGGGVVGSAVALEIAARGAPVLLLDADQPGTRATGASAGMVSVQYEASSSSALVRFGARSRAAFSTFARFLEVSSEWPVEFRRDGMLVANRSEDEEAEALEMLEWQWEMGLRGRILEPAETLRHHARVSPEIRSWLWLPDEAQVNAQKLAVALDTALTSSGVRVARQARVTELLSRSGGVTGVRTEDGQVHASSSVVLAAGAWTDGIEGLPREVPVRPVRGQILRLLPEEIPEWPLIASREGRYIVPRENGTVLVGSTMEEAGFDDTVTREGSVALASAAVALVPSLAEAPVVERWAGLRPMSRDGLPIIGPDPGLEGLVYATGHGRAGVMLAPATGEVVADLVLEDAWDAAWEPFGITRFESPSGGEEGPSSQLRSGSSHCG